MQTGYYYLIPTILAEGGDMLKAMIYGLVSSLTKKEGYCYASNKYIAEKLGVHPQTVSKKVSELVEEEWLQIELLDNHRRRLYLYKLKTIRPETKGVSLQAKGGKPTDLGGGKPTDLYSNINNSIKRKEAAELLPSDEEIEEITYEEYDKPYQPLKRKKKPLRKSEQNAVAKLCNMFSVLAGIEGDVDAKPWVRPISGLYKACNKDYQATINFMRDGIAYFENRGLSYTPHTLYKNKPLIEKWLKEEQNKEDEKYNSPLYE